MEIEARSPLRNFGWQMLCYCVLRMSSNVKKISCLNIEQDDGRNKARLFLSILGMTADNGLLDLLHQSSNMSRPAFAIFAQQYFSALLGDFGTVYLNEPVPRDPKLRVHKIPSRFNWGTEVLSALTRGNDRIIISPEIISEAELVDVLFEPDNRKSRAELGLLGELLFVPCIIAPLRWLPMSWEIRTYMRFWLKWQAESDRTIFPVNETPVYKQNKREDEDEDEGEAIDKSLLIVVPSITPQQLNGWTAEPSNRNIPGIYDLPPAFCTTIVAIAELPSNPDTLWLRLLGRGLTQRQAIVELMHLKSDYPFRTVVLQQFKQWEQLLLQGRMGKESKHLMQVLSQIDINS